MPTIRNRFYPLHDINEHDIVNLYSLDQSSGLAGQLVKIVTGAANPSLFDGWAVNTPVGANIPGTISFRYESKAKITPTVSGDTRYGALGLTLYSTLEFDENGQPLRYNVPRAKEIGAVLSGENVPVATKGLFGIWGQYIDTSLGSIQPGNLVVVSRSGNGQLAAISPTSANFNATGGAAALSSFVYTPAHVVGKWISSLPTAPVTGVGTDFSAQGGYGLFILNCGY